MKLLNVLSARPFVPLACGGGLAWGAVLLPSGMHLVQPHTLVCVCVCVC
jgi:hypothetical protein